MVYEVVGSSAETSGWGHHKRYVGHAASECIENHAMILFLCFVGSMHWLWASLLKLLGLVH